MTEPGRKKDTRFSLLLACLRMSSLTAYQALRTQLPEQHAKSYYQVTAPATLRYISDEITARLAGVMPGRNIIVPDDQIISVLDSFYTNMPNDPNILVMSTISFIVQHISTETLQERQNNQLSIWVGSKPESFGLSRHDQLKTSNRRPTSGQIPMRY